MSDTTEKVMRLHSKDAAEGFRACAELEELSARSSEVYEYFDELASMLHAKSSYERNRALALLAANARWDVEDKFSQIIGGYLALIHDPKPITARQCIKLLPVIARHKPALADEITAALTSADASRYADSMRPLIEGDIACALAEIAAG